MIRVVLVDDQAVVRAGFRVLLEDAGGIEVAGEASNGRDAVALVARERPDVVLMDLRMPGGDGIAATREIVAARDSGSGGAAAPGPAPGSPTAAPASEVPTSDPAREAGTHCGPAVLVVTTFDLDRDVFGALEAGADGFILKDCEPEELIGAVRRLASGQGLVDHAVTRRVIAEFARRRRPALDPEAVGLLTPREGDIVRLLATGMSNAEIAQELFVETSTVKSHLGRAMMKIGARDRVQTVIWAHRNGFAEPE